MKERVPLAVRNRDFSGMFLLLAVQEHVGSVLVYFLYYIYFYIIIIIVGHLGHLMAHCKVCLQCFDAVGWAAGRASCL